MCLPHHYLLCFRDIRFSAWVADLSERPPLRSQKLVIFVGVLTARPCIAQSPRPGAATVPVRGLAGSTLDTFGSARRSRVAQRCPNELKLIPKGAKIIENGLQWEGLWGNTLQPYWVRGNLKIAGHSTLFFDEFRIGIRRQCKTTNSVVKLTPVGGLPLSYIYIYILDIMHIIERERETPLPC